MRLLVSNDDGVHAPGIIALAEALAVLGVVDVVAPDRDRSGASNSLTLSQPLRARLVAPGRIAVTGTPTDCVHLALGGLIAGKPDIVVSGINNSANLGDDTLYSGTVAAAMEGRNLGLPAIAISLCSESHPASNSAERDSTTNKGKHFETAARVAVQLVQQLLLDPLPSDTLLNVNVPDLPWELLRGFSVTRLGNRHRSEPMTEQRDPRGNLIYWIGPAGPIADGIEGTDFYAVANGFVSITPITIDLTRHSAMAAVGRFVSQLSNQSQSSA